jgi:hypothetical protein
MKYRKLFAAALVAIIVCATLALGFQQNQIRTPNPISTSGQVLELNVQTIDVKDLPARIIKLENKVEQLQQQIDEMQRPRVIPVNQK